MRTSSTKLLSWTILLIWVIGIVNLIPLPFDTINQLRSNIDKAGQADISSESKHTVKPNSVESVPAVRIENASQILWAKWVGEATLILFGISMGILTAKGTKRWLTGAIFASIMFLATWTATSFNFDQNPLAMYALLASNITKFGDGVDLILFLVRNVFLPIAHVILIGVLISSIRRATGSARKRAGN